MSNADLDDLESWARDVETRFMLDATLALQAVAELRQGASSGDAVGVADDRDQQAQPLTGERANAALDEMRDFISAHYPGPNRPVWDALDTVRAALAQQAQPPMPLTDLVAKWRAVEPWDTDIPYDVGVESGLRQAADELDAALAQQAQPLTDSDASRIALAVFDADGPDSRSIVHDIVLRYEARRRRNRMAQQAQPGPVKP